MNEIIKHGLQNQLEQIPEYDAQGEDVTIGAMLIEPHAARVGLEMLTAKDFHQPTRQQVFVVMQEIGWERVDVETVRHYLNSAGGMMDRCVMKCPSPANIESYCNNLIAFTRKRSEREAATQLLGGQREKALQTLERTASRVKTISAGHSEVQQELENEVTGKAKNEAVPDWPVLSSIGALLPGKVLLIAGPAGHGKSMFMAEMFWRMVFKNKVKTACLMLEESPPFHLRRIAAQMLGDSRLTNSDWVVDHGDEAMALMEQVKDEMEMLRTNLFCMGEKTKVDVNFLLSWIEEKAASGCRVICLDPVTIMLAREGREKHVDQQELVVGVKRIAEHHGCSVICVTHPKDPTAPPSMQNISGSAFWTQFTQCIIWYSRHDVENAVFSQDPQMPSEGKQEPYNRTIHTLKVRSRFDPEKIAFWFDGKTLRHIERGILKKTKGF